MTKKRAPKTGVEPKPAAGSEPAPGQGFPTVGIGASAGGLAAFQAFFSAMPAEPCDMAFVLVQLLEPGAPRGVRLPIDFFFRSLAQDQREHAICIVLSGSGSDGALGVRAIKGEGGMVMVQDPASTEHGGMPESAIATGLVDYVLPPERMPVDLIAYVAHAFGKRPRPVLVPPPQAEDALKKLCVLLRDRTGHDFSQYKKATLLCRVERRMALHQIERSSDYLRYAQQSGGGGGAVPRPPGPAGARTGTGSARVRRASGTTWSSPSPWTICRPSWPSWTARSRPPTIDGAAVGERSPPQDSARTTLIAR
jgi:two-component system CheB/CheR fusion protein